MDKVITATFPEGSNTVTVYGLWQWDHGISLQIMGLSLPETVEVHFALANGEPVKQEGHTTDGITTVDIPDSMLAGPTGSGTFCGTQAFLVNAWVYVEDGESGRTVKMVKLNVKTRAKPPDYIATPEERKTWEQLQEGKADRLALAGSILSLMSGDRLLSEVTLPTGGGGEELADIRVGADGKIYASAGEAVRVQVGELNKDLGDFKDLADFADSNDDSKDTLYIVDVNGKIIATVSKEGIDTVGYKKHGEDFVPGSVDLLETYDDVFYIADGNGNVIFKASKDGIEGVNISASSPSPYKDKVLISIGDSLSAHDKWQKWLVEWWGCKFDADKNVNGDGDYPPMAKGGTAIMPNSTDSIYIRALSASHYNPDIIIVYAGQNDVPRFGSATEVNPTAVGTIDDVPYRKTVPYTELEESEYSDYTSWYQGRPTLYSCCMGLVENLLTSCPKAQIIVVTPMQMWTSDGTQSVGRKQLVTTWHDICNKYALPIIDLWNESGVNAFNMSEYYPNVGNVHPNDYGYKRIAETIYSRM